MSPSQLTRAEAGPADAARGKRYRRPAVGAAQAQRKAFGREWGAYAKQVSQDLRRERA